MFFESTTTIVILAIILIAQANHHCAKQQHRVSNIAARQAENAPVAIQTWPASDGSVTGPYAPYAFAFDDPSNLLTLDSEEWLPEDASKRGVLLDYLTSDPKGLNFLTQNGSDVSSLQNYIGIGLMRRHFSIRPNGTLSLPTTWHAPKIT